MEYKGIELTEFKTTENIFFDKPKKMLVWDDTNTECLKADVVAVILSRKSYPVVGVRYTWQHCAEIPEESKPKLVTYRELAKWLAQGNGELRIDMKGTAVNTYMCYALDSANEPVPPNYVVRKWEDDDWNQPTREYLGLEDK